MNPFDVSVTVIQAPFIRELGKILGPAVANLVAKGLPEAAGWEILRLAMEVSVKCDNALKVELLRAPAEIKFMEASPGATFEVVKESGAQETIRDEPGKAVREVVG